MIDHETRERYFMWREQYPLMRAADALMFAREPDNEYGIAWQDGKATVAIDGLTFVATVAEDACQDISLLGEWWRQRVRRRCHRFVTGRMSQPDVWWVEPTRSVEECFGYYHTHGLSKGVAWETALDEWWDDVDRLCRYIDGDWRQLVVSVEVRWGGMILGGASLGGVEGYDEDHVTAVAETLIRELEGDARAFVAEQVEGLVEGVFA